MRTSTMLKKFQTAAAFLFGVNLVLLIIALLDEKLVLAFWAVWGAGISALAWGLLNEVRFYEW